jgi:hypothetical protein
MTPGRAFVWVAVAALLAGCHRYRDDLELICHTDPARPSAPALGERVHTARARRLFEELGRSDLTHWATRLREEALAEGIPSCPLADALTMRAVPLAPAAPAEHLTLEMSLDRDGRVALAGNALKESEWLARLDEALRQDPEAQVVIAADSGVVYSRIVHFMDLAKRHGAKRFALKVDADAGVP